MPPPLSSATASRNDAELRQSLLENALDLIAIGGRRSASVRAVAERAQASPSAVIYHFGGKEALLDAAYALARGRDRQWRAAALADLPGGAKDPSMFGGFLHAVVHADGITHGDLSRVRWDCFLSTELVGDHHEVSASWSADHEDFWRAALRAFSADDTAATIVAEFADALARLYLSARSGVSHMAWTGEASARFAERLLGPQHGSGTPQKWRMAYLAADGDLFDASAAEAEWPAVALRVVKGAAEIVLRAGPQALTHRAVAAAAGVSLSSTTYHFASRSDIMRAAYRWLYADWIRRSGSTAIAPASGQSPDEVIDRMMTAMFPRPGVVAPEQLVHQMIQLDASRDIELRREMDELRAATGPATTALLTSIDDLAETVDDLDGFCFATWVTGLSRATRLQPQSMREDYMRRRYRTALRVLFGV